VHKPVLNSAGCIDPTMQALEVLAVAVLVVLKHRPGDEICDLHEARGGRVHVERNFDEAMQGPNSVPRLPTGHQGLKDVLVARVVRDNQGAV
jgi:hypothetical protein